MLTRKRRRARALIINRTYVYMCVILFALITGLYFVGHASLTVMNMVPETQQDMIINAA